MGSLGYSIAGSLAKRYITVDELIQLVEQKSRQGIEGDNRSDQTHGGAKLIHIALGIDDYGIVIREKRLNTDLLPCRMTETLPDGQSHPKRRQADSKWRRRSS